MEERKKNPLMKRILREEGKQKRRPWRMFFVNILFAVGMASSAMLVTSFLASCTASIYGLETTFGYSEKPPIWLVPFALFSILGFRKEVREGIIAFFERLLCE